MNSKTVSSKDGKWPPNVGIVAMEIYFPYQYVDQAELEEFDGVSSKKYTLGLGQEKMSFTTDREDVHSICLTVVRRLMEKYGFEYQRIGRLEVGTESSLDRSKSVKTVLMQLFKASGNTNVEGVDCINACYGATAALFNSVAWIESSAWDGRFAMVVAGDIVVYGRGPGRPTGGAGAIALLLGQDAALVLERGLRATHSCNVYDFYKPDTRSEYPQVDGRLSIQCYLSSLDKCYEGYRVKAEERSGERITVESFDGIVFHCPYGKIVQKSFGRLLLHDVQSMDKKTLNDEYPSLLPIAHKKLDQCYFNSELHHLLMVASQKLFDIKTKPSLAISSQVGNMNTASLYANLIAYVMSKSMQELLGNRICLFSYGSGLMASMFSMRIRPEAVNELTQLRCGLINVFDQLEQRQKCSPEVFTRIMLLREHIYDKAPYFPVADVESLFDSTYTLTHVTDNHQREYYWIRNQKRSTIKSSGSAELSL